VQDRGLAAYIAELVGTFLLVFFITSVVTLYVASGANAQFGSDFAVVGLVHAFVLFGLIITLGTVSGGHFNPAVTAAAAFLRKIDPVDALVYVLAQLSGGVLGALLTKGLLLDEGRAGDYGAVKLSPLLGSNAQGAVVEAIGALVLVLAVCAVAFRGKENKDWGPLSIGATLGMAVMVLGPLTGGSFNPARWFGPALVGNQFSGAWLYIIGPLVGGLLAALLYRFVIEGGPPKPATSTPAGSSTPSSPGSTLSSPGSKPAQ
jgi:MIP family channel proteins